MSKTMLSALSVLALLSVATAAQAAPLCGPIDVTVDAKTLGAGDDVSATYRKLKVAADQARAKLRAISAWQAKVKAQCPANSSLWPRASARKLEICDQAMGGRFSICATATPHAKGF